MLAHGYSTEDLGFTYFVEADTSSEEKEGTP